MGLTQTPLSGSAAALVGLGVFGVVAFDMTWQVLTQGAVAVGGKMLVMPT